MKINHVVYFISFFLLFSCSNTAIISHHWANYVNSNPAQNELSSINNLPVEEDFSFIQLELINLQKDSVVIVTKSGKTYSGIVTKSDFDGYFIKIEKNREIYVGNFEIKSIQFIKSPSVINTPTRQENTTPNATVLKEEISTEINSSTNLSPRKIGIEESSKPRSENDVWNNTNSKFETSKKDIYREPIPNSKNKRKKIQEPFSTASLIALILSPFTRGLGFLAAFIFSAVSLSRIKNNPEKYKGRTLARIIFGLCLAASLIVIFSVALFLALW